MLKCTKWPYNRWGSFFGQANAAGCQAKVTKWQTGLSVNIFRNISACYYPRCYFINWQLGGEYRLIFGYYVSLLSNSQITLLSLRVSPFKKHLCAKRAAGSFIIHRPSETSKTCHREPLWWTSWHYVMLASNRDVVAYITWIDAECGCVLTINIEVHILSHCCPGAV